MPRTACPRIVSFATTLAVLTGLSLLGASPGGHQTDRFGDWTPPVNLGDTVNSPSQEILPALSKNGSSLYFASDRPGSMGGEDLWVARRTGKDAPWEAPVNLGAAINTAFNERSPELSRDGHFLFFATNRPGGLGDFDIWVAWRAHIHDDFGWRPAVNLSAGVNSASGDFGPGFFENDAIGIPLLYFASTRPGGLGSADIYRSALQRYGGFGPATPVSELNSPQGDFRPSLRADGLESSSTRIAPVRPTSRGSVFGTSGCRGAARRGRRGRRRPTSVRSSTARSTTTSRCCRATAPRW